MTNSTLMGIEKLQWRMAQHYVKRLREQTDLFLDDPETALSQFDVAWPQMQKGYSYALMYATISEVWFDLILSYSTLERPLRYLRQPITDRLSWVKTMLNIMNKVNYPVIMQAGLMIMEGEIYYAIGNYDDALERNQTALLAYHGANNLSILGSSDGLQAIALTNIGSCYYRLGELEKAIGYQREALRLARKAHSTAAIAQALVQLGLTLQQRNDLESAIECYEEASLLWHQMKNLVDEMSTLGNLANVYREQNAYDKAMHLYEHIVDISTKLGNTRTLTDAYLNLATIHIHRLRVEEALPILIKAETAALSLRDPLALSAVYAQKGNAYSKLGRHREGLDWYVKASNTLPTGEKYIRASILVNLGNAHESVGELTKSLETLAEAKSLYEELRLQDNIEMVKHRLTDIEDRLAGLPNYLAEAEPPESRIEFIQQALSYARNINDVQQEMNEMQELLRSYAESGQFVLAAQTCRQIMNKTIEHGFDNDLHELRFILIRFLRESEHYEEMAKECKLGIESLDSYDFQIQLNKGNGQNLRFMYFQNLSLAYAFLGRMAEAKSLIYESLQEPNIPNLLLIPAFIHLGTILASEQDFYGSLIFFGKAILQNDDNNQSEQLLETALEVIRKTIESDDPIIQSMVHWQLGYLLLNSAHQMKYTALAHLELAIEILHKNELVTLPDGQQLAKLKTIVGTIYSQIRDNYESIMSAFQEFISARTTQDQYHIVMRCEAQLLGRISQIAIAMIIDNLDVSEKNKSALHELRGFLCVCEHHGIEYIFRQASSYDHIPIDEPTPEKVHAYVQSLTSLIVDMSRESDLLQIRKTIEANPSLLHPASLPLFDSMIYEGKKAGAPQIQLERLQRYKMIVEMTQRRGIEDAFRYLSQSELNQ